MSFHTSDIAKIPNSGYDWYLFLLMESWDDSYHEAIIKNLHNLANAVGPNCLLVTGLEQSTLCNPEIHHLISETYIVDPIFETVC